MLLLPLLACFHSVGEAGDITTTTSPPPCVLITYLFTHSSSPPAKRKHHHNYYTSRRGHLHTHTHTHEAERPCPQFHLTLNGEGQKGPNQQISMEWKERKTSTRETVDNGSWFAIVYIKSHFQEVGLTQIPANLYHIRGP